MSAEAHKWSDEYPVLATGLGIGGFAALGGAEVLEHSQNIVVKALELGSLGLLGAAGLVGGIGYALQRTRDRDAQTQVGDLSGSTPTPLNTQ